TKWVCATDDGDVRLMHTRSMLYSHGGGARLQRRVVDDNGGVRSMVVDGNDGVRWRWGATAVDGFNASHVRTLIEKFIDLRPVPSGLLFRGGLATTWEFPGIHPIFKDTEGNGGGSKDCCYKGKKSPCRSIEERGQEKRCDSGESSWPKVKRRKTSAARKDRPASSEHISSSDPLQTVVPTGGHASINVARTAESCGDQSIHIPIHD
nr:hypothetical protein [Tanacetum cinerariifolium]